MERFNSQLSYRIFTSTVLMLSLMSIYLLLNNNLEHKIDLLLPLDLMIPYWPWTACIYFTLYFMYFTVAVITESQRYTQVALDIVLMTLISFVCFTLITSHYPRPSPEAWAHSLWKPIIDLMVSIDAPGNTCPSLHVSTSIYIALFMRGSRRGAIWVIWGILVSLSTLTLKQHFVWDWIAGVILAIFVMSLNPFTRRLLDQARGR